MKPIGFALSLLALFSAQAAAAAPPVGGRPQENPTRATTNFDGALRCMDELLQRSNMGSGYVLVAQKLDDPTGKMGMTRDMIISAASRMSEKSRFFTIMTDLPKEASSIFKTQGSITALDQQVESDTKGGALTFGTAFGATARKRLMTSHLTVSLYFVNARNEIVSGTFHSQTLALRTKSNSSYVGGTIGTVGGSLDFVASVDEGQQAAARALIELAMIEAVGSFAQVPYANCLAKVSADPADRTQAWKDFNALKPAQREAMVRDAMLARRLIGPDAGPQQLRQAIAAFERAQGLSPIGEASFEVFYALRRVEADPGPQIALNRPAGRGPAVRVAPSGGAFIYGPGRKVPIVNHGDKVAFEITVAEPAYVACYYTDAKRVVARVFPNASRSAYRLNPGETLRIPGDQDGFAIKPEVASSTEWMTCLAAPDDFLGRISDQVPDKALKRLSDFDSASALIAAARKADPKLSADTMTFEVK